MQQQFNKTRDIYYKIYIYINILQNDTYNFINVIGPGISSVDKNKERERERERKTKVLLVRKEGVRV